MKKILIAMCTGVLLMTSSYLAAAQTYRTLDKINLDGDSLTVTLSGKTRLHAFRMANPSRLIVEFNNTEYNVKAREIDGKGSLVKRIRGGQFKNEPVKVARIVFDLTSSVEYQIVANGRQVRVNLSPVTGNQQVAAPAVKPVVTTPPVVPSMPVAVKPVTGKSLPVTGKPAVVPAQAKTAPASGKSAIKTAQLVTNEQVIPAAPMAVPASADKHKKDTIKAAVKAVPKENVAVAQKPAAKTALTEEKTPDVKILTPLEPVPDEKSTVIAAPLPEKNDREKANETKAAPVARKGADERQKSVPVPAVSAAVPVANKVAAVPAKVSLPKKPITLDFEEADIRDVLRVLSMKSGINIIYGSDVTGTVSIRLENVPFDKAFETILSLKNLVSQEQGGNILRVVTPQKISDERAQAVTFTKIFPLNYAKGDEVKVNLDSIRSAEGRRGNVSVDGRTNSLIVTDTPEGLTSVEQIISELDQKPQQVMIEAKIVEIVLTDNLDLGIEWEYARTIPTANGVMTIGQSNVMPTDTLGVGKTGQAEVRTANSALNSGTGVMLPATAVGGQIGSISFGLVEDSSRLTSMITALAQKGLSKLLSNPKVTTINNRTAKILVGQKIPYTTSTVSVGGTTQQTNFLDVGVKLNVTPTINVDRKITLDVHPEVSLFIRADPAGPVIGTREAQTTVIVANGETVVIGGLITEDDRKLGTQVPLLGDLPVIGFLFRHQNNTKDRTELLVFLTPHILE
jgi:type IV pilus assembly protein PilQ